MYYIPLEVHLDWAFQIDYCDSLCIDDSNGFRVSRAKLRSPFLLTYMCIPKIIAPDGRVILDSQPCIETPKGYYLPLYSNKCFKELPDLPNINFADLTKKFCGIDGLLHTTPLKLDSSFDILGIDPRKFYAAVASSYNQPVLPLPDNVTILMCHNFENCAIENILASDDTKLYELYYKSDKTGISAVSSIISKPLALKRCNISEKGAYIPSFQCLVAKYLVLSGVNVAEDVLLTAEHNEISCSATPNVIVQALSDNCEVKIHRPEGVLHVHVKTSGADIKITNAAMSKNPGSKMLISAAMFKNSCSKILISGDTSIERLRLADFLACEIIIQCNVDFLEISNCYNWRFMGTAGMFIFDDDAYEEQNNKHPLSVYPVKDGFKYCFSHKYKGRGGK